MATTASRRMDRLSASIGPFMAFFTGPFAKLNKNPDVANFAVGNPQDFPLPEYVDALRGQLDPRRRDWFAYKDNEPRSRIAVARGIAARTGMPWDRRRGDDQRRLCRARRGDARPGRAGRRGDLPVAAVVLLRVHDPRGGWRPGPPAPPAAAFEPDMAEIAAAITPRTRAILFNSPHNPSGRVYPLETLQALGTHRHRCLRAHRPPIYRHLRGALTTGSSSTASPSIRRRRCIRTRWSPTPTGSSCWRRACASAT